MSHLRFLPLCMVLTSGNAALIWSPLAGMPPLVGMDTSRKSAPNMSANLDKSSFTFSRHYILTTFLGAQACPPKGLAGCLTLTATTGNAALPWSPLACMPPLAGIGMDT